MRVIAFCGPKTCGKDTAANALYDQNYPKAPNIYFRQASFAEGVKNVCQEFFGWDHAQMAESTFKETPIPLWASGPEMAPRWPMMDIANWLREKYGFDIHAQRWERQAFTYDTPGIAHVVTDLRFPNELAYMKKHDAFVIYVKRDQAEEALKSAKAKGDAMALNPSEAHYDLLIQYARNHGRVIENNTTITDLHAQVQNAVKERFQHWGYWEAADMQTQVEGEGNTDGED